LIELASSVVRFIIIDVFWVSIFILIFVFFGVASSVVFGDLSLGLLGGSSWLFGGLESFLVSLLSLSLGGKFGLFLALFLLQSLLFSFPLSSLFHHLPDCLVFSAFWPRPGSGAGLSLFARACSLLLHVELDVWTKSLKQEIIQELLDEASELARG
jgi:hypothetical protein